MSATSSAGRTPVHLTGCGQFEIQLVERAGGVGDDGGGDVQIKSGGCQLGVAEQQLNGADVGAGFEQMGGKAVAQAMQTDRLAETRRTPRRATGDLQPFSADR